MQLLAVLALASTVWLGAASAQSNPVAESHASCIERLQMPAYPKLADAARVSGTLTATITLAPDGSIQNTVLEMGPRKSLFSKAVEEALRASTFRRSCAGKSVILIFHFVLATDLDKNSLPQTISFGYPNQFWISVPPQIIQP